MTNVFPEGSYFHGIFEENPDLIIEIRNNGVSVYSLVKNETGFSDLPINLENTVQKDLSLIALSIKELM